MANQVTGIMGGAASAINGIKKAGQLQEQAAVDVQRAFRPETETRTETEPAATVQVSEKARDLAGAFTDMMKAESLNAASVKVLQTADDMTKELTKVKR
jgi:hypothetical protein